MKFFFLSLISIIIISFLVLIPSFNLAFEDEDWRGVVLPKTDYANIKLSTYTIPVWFMGTLYTWLGPNFYPYYILAFIFRNLLAFSILVFIYTITKDRLASYLGGLFLVVSFTGIMNTYEVMNMITYISMTGLIIFLIFFFKILDKFSFIHLMPMGISLIFSTFLVSARVYPIYVWAFIVDSSRLLIRFKKNMIKPFLIRQFLILIIFLFLYKIGIFSWYTIGASSGEGMNDISKFISDTTTFVTNLNQNIATNFLKGLGNIIFPSTLDESGTVSLFLGLAFVIIFIFAFIYGIKNKSRNSYLFTSFLLWQLLFYTLYFLIYINGGHKDSSPLPSNMRYLLPPFIGFNIALMVFLSLAKRTQLKGIILGFVFILILIHSISTFSFLSKLSKLRDGPFMMKIWKQIPQLVPQSSLSSQKMNVFYFETDDPTRAIYTVNDGFIGHTVALYKIDSKPAKFDAKEISAFSSLIAPPIITFDELAFYIQKSLSENPEPDIWNRIFALKIEGEKVIDIKEDVRKRVEASF